MERPDLTRMLPPATRRRRGIAAYRVLGSFVLCLLARVAGGQERLFEEGFESGGLARWSSVDGVATVRLLVIGDTGTGSPEQACVGQAMGAACLAAGGCTAVLMNSGIGRRSGEVGRNLTVHPAFRVMARFDEPVKGWLLRVLHNAFVDGARRAKRSPVAARGETDVEAFASASPGPEESAYAAQREEKLQRAWLQLERDQRALLALRAEGYSLAEMAQITALEIDVLNARLYRARHSFARHLREESVPHAARTEIAK